MPSYNLADLFEIVTSKAPDRLALVSGGARLTFGALEQRAAHAAGHLLAAEVKPGETVAILAWNRAEWLESMLGCFKIGAVPVGINYRYVDAEASYVLSEAGCTAIITEAGFLPMIERIKPDLPSLGHVVVLDDGSGCGATGLATTPYEAALAAAGPPPSRTRSGDAHYIVHTGGTTGMPKGVIWRHEDFFFTSLGGGNYAGAPIARPGDIGVYLDGPSLPTFVTSPLMHGNGQVHALGAMLEGRAAVLWTGRHFDPAAIADLVESEQPAVLVLTGDVMARPLVDYLTAADRPHELASVIVISSGATPLSVDVRERLREFFPSAQVADTFGASESGVLGRRLQREGDDGTLRFEMPEDVRVLREDLSPVEPGSGETGQIARCGRLPLGYLNDPDKTAETFRTGANGVRWAVLGDVARVDADGSVVLLGRGSNCINTGGEKVFTEEVELAAKSHPGVQDAIVIGLPDPRFGERVAAVVSFVAEPIALEELQTYLRGKLAGYKIPRSLIPVDQIQHTATGKPDYRWAREVAASA